ncbi:MAG: dihydroorotate dehydrogenase [Candidatus Omnitrophica bacterium]|nr:dihydroorotate dehydrogenase [Candidatus Omnitrophota bacterium]
MVRSGKPDLGVRINKLNLKNPVMAASGTFGYAEEFKDLMDLKKLGAVVTKTITLKPRPGNPPPRICETPSGMLNSVGLENPGIDAFISTKLAFLKKLGIPLSVSIAAEESPVEFEILIGKLEAVKEIAAIELNISCPNLRKDKLVSQDAGDTAAVVGAVRKLTSKILITKLSPNVTCITDIAMAAEDAGSDALALINTLSGMRIDVRKRIPMLGSRSGGLSGPAVRPVAVKMVWDVYNKIKIPIIGMGGIMDVESALEFFIAGASAVSLGTVNFVNPGACLEVISGLERYMINNRIPDLSRLTGSLKLCQD